MRPVPTSTYRLQITADFDLYAAADLVPYLHDLGVDWVYLSPLLAAEAGSTHGYDVVDHAVVDASRGGIEGLRALSDAAHGLDMGVLVDIVPNHVGIADPSGNAWWWDVLTNGRDSAYADAFDIDWEAGGGRVRIPVLGDDGQTTPGGPIANLTVLGDRLRYHDQEFPIAPSTGGGSPDEVHARQSYELVNWRMADDGLNYRRFFAVNTLAAVRVEDPVWFEKTHEAIRGWFDEGLVDGLRVDHPDGLRDPHGYLDDLSRLTGGAYVLVEKILEPGEQLRHAWATAGTTGYDALALIDRVLTDPVGQGPLDSLETRLRGAPVVWADMVHDNKRAVADGILRSEVLRISRELAASPGFDLLDVADAVAELIACFPVYRSYLPDGRAWLDEADALARARRPDLVPVLDVVTPLLADAASDAALRFQQTSGMVMAKGVEDCSFYRWSRLTSLNEVGADPAIFSLPVSDFHAAMATRQDEWPDAMTTLSTHDTKRGEDVRARIAVLAEVPDRWVDALDKLLELAPLPDPGFGALLWQAVLGAWPASRDRLHGYAEKAMREAGDRTTWTAPDTAYEAAVHAAVDQAYDDPRVSAVLEDLLARITAAGWSNSLSMKLVALTVPGVPDVYQGSELWEQSLVDPDNRRPVDFEQRQRILSQVLAGERPVLTSALDDLGAAKLLVTQVALTLRRTQPERFASYRPVEVTGPAADHLLAFDRGGAITVATRLPAALTTAGWGDTALVLPDGTWADLLTGREVSSMTPVSEVLADYPVALLVSTTAADAGVVR
jgi:(1->4)-alpha-D-glucan 1-alpha-D-glucosylmutase